MNKVGKKREMYYNRNEKKKKKKKIEIEMKRRNGVSMSFMGIDCVRHESSHDNCSIGSKPWKFCTNAEC